MSGRTPEDLLAFLDYVGEKGLVPAPTAAARKASARQIVAVLNEREASDVTGIDLDQVMKRFHNLNVGKYSPTSLQTYESRMRSSLQDFSSYLADPLSFKASGARRERSRMGEDKSARKPSAKVTASHDRDDSPPPSTTHLPGIHVLPIALRSGLTVQIAGLPFDLSKAEAQRIANIVLAHAVVDDER